MRRIYMCIVRRDITREYFTFEVEDDVGEDDICPYDYVDDPDEIEHLDGEEMDSRILTEEDYYKVVKR